MSGYELCKIWSVKYFPVIYLCFTLYTHRTWLRMHIYRIKGYNRNVNILYNTHQLKCSEKPRTFRTMGKSAFTVLFLYLGLNSPVGDCDAGFYCPGGDSVPNPNATPCPIGLHCPVGTGTPVPCESGTYTNLTQQSSCIICPAGYYCTPSQVIVGKWNVQTYLWDL